MKTGKKFLFFVALVFTSIQLYSAVQITDVKATPISPWAVKIDYRVVGGNGNDPLLFASNTITHQVYRANPNAIKGDFKLTEGRHSIRWNLMEDDVKWDRCDVAFEILDDKTYCVIDLSGGANATSYPVIYLPDIPSGGWKKEHKTTKLVLRLIEPGSFKMKGSYDVTLAKHYYIGVFEVTQKQYELVTGNKPSYYKGDTRPVEQVTWDTIRGLSANWPNVKTVDPNSFIGSLCLKTGLHLDLPTEAQWEYACRAGTTSSYNNGGNSEADLKTLGRYFRNESDGRGGYYSEHTTVGSYAPNNWGLYDMHGNVFEWCLDWYGSLSNGSDPIGPVSGSRRVVRGGSWVDDASHCTSSYRNNCDPSNYGSPCGFRLACSAGL